MRKFLSLMISALVILSLFSACGSSNTAASGSQNNDANQAESYTLKMHLSIGQTDPVYAAAEKFANTVNETSNGNIKVELYASSSLGNTADCLEGLSLRVCDIVFDAFSNLASITEIANIDAAPYLYSSVDHYRAVWEGQVGADIMKEIGEQSSMVLLGAGLQGSRVLTTTVPVRNVEDAKGLKLRVPTIPMFLDTWTWLGATPTPLGGSEVFTAIQQGTVSGAENPYTSIVSLSWQECSDYITETNHVYSTDAFIMDAKLFNSMPEEYQTIIRNAAVEAGKFCTESVLAATDEKKQICVDAGCEIIETDIAQWQEKFDGFLEEKYPSLVKYAEMIASVDPQ